MTDESADKIITDPANNPSASEEAAGRRRGRWVKGVSGNPKGRPKEGESWAGVIKKALSLTPERIAKLVGTDNSLGSVFQQMPEGVKMKDLLVYRAMAEFMMGSSPSIWNMIMERSEGAAPSFKELMEQSAKEADQKERASGVRLTADMIAGSFSNLHLDILDHAHTEYVLTGGRGSTKSSFISLELISLLENNPTWHALVLRQVGNTLRDSVYSQISWAIHQIGHGDRFKFTLSPLEITYLPTGQKIYFRGADDPNKIKSIKPEFGAIGILWFEELDQYDGANAIRKIEQSAIRGTDSAYIFKSFNPPPTANNWANKYVQIPKAKQFLHFSNYLDVPKKWLGQVFYDEAEHLKLVNPRAYEHEYMGIANATGGQVFENVAAREITDAEIAQFDRVEHGLDFGYYPDPAHYARVHYDAARLTLYVYGEVRRYKTRNEELFKALTAYGYNPADMLICDNAEPKSVEDFISYGANARRAEKGADSVTYSIKWLQSLAAIVIDPKRAPETLTEFLDYEYERTKDGEVISAFPDKNNHAIDAVRYATNLIWRKRGQ